MRGTPYFGSIAIRNKGVCTITNRPRRIRKKIEPSVSLLEPRTQEIRLNYVLGLLNRTTTIEPVVKNKSRWEWKEIDTTEVHQELRRLVSLWIESGPHLGLFFKRNPDLQEFCMHGRTILMPTREGLAQLGWLPHSSHHRIKTQEDRALALFTELLVNPGANQLGGPCARCNSFYVKNTKRQKVYCSRDCGSVQTAMSATQRSRRLAYNKKLAKAERRIERWMNGRRGRPWKVSVADGVEITIKWLTRAVNAGKLAEPSIY